MEFVDNTGHIFSLKSYSEKPIGYEYEENSYIFWIDSNTSKLSINNYYSRPIYALYLLNKNYNVNDLCDDENSPIQISIEIENSNVYKLINSNYLNQYISSGNYTSLNDYIDFNEDSECFSSILTNKDLCIIKTTETVQHNENMQPVEFDYLLIPIYPIAYTKEEGTWITNIMIHITDVKKHIEEWCPISVGGEFINEYEELIINGKNIGVNLPKDILKAVYSESLYNDEFNESLYNEKLKEYLINKNIIKNECGNFNSAIASLKWFGYGDKISISKLLKTDNTSLNQYLLDFFNIKNDIIESFKLFTSSALISLKLMINKESDELYKFETDNDFFGENKPKMISLLDSYQKIKIGNHDMPIENDDEKYWYYKPYFDFSFNELGIKLACLKIFYKQYFLPLHLYIHNASLGYKVYANDIKYTITSGVAMSEPIISLNVKNNEVEFSSDDTYYFSKQLHYVDSNFNEFTVKNINEDNREWYEINDTCVSIPIKFINSNYYNCVLLLINENISNRPLLETHFSFCTTEDFEYKNFIIYPKKLNIKVSKNDNDINIVSNYFEYWINDGFVLKLLVNNKWYEHHFNLKINNPTIDFGTLRYRYYLNDHNYLLSQIKNSDVNVHNLIFTDEVDKINNTFNIRSLDMSRSFIKTLNISNVNELWQYFESNYNILSPFTQLSGVDHDNKIVSFNAYMHNCELINVNNIDFDIDFYKVLKYHLDHNLMYIDGTLLNRDFYQYIIYKHNDKEVDVLLHKDLIGYDIEIPLDYLNKDKIIVCAWNDNLYILEETGEHNETYYINTLNSNVFMSENESYALLLNSLNLHYNKVNHTYYSQDPITGTIIDVYYIYDKLYSNTDYIYNKYQDEISLPNLDKYKNSLHLFNIYTLKEEMHNILVLHNDIDVYINGLRFRTGQYVYDNNESHKIYISGNIGENETINSNNLTSYGLNFIDNIDNLPEEIRLNNYEYGFYVMRDYEKHYNQPKLDIYDLDDIFDFSNEEFSYYHLTNNGNIVNLPIGSMCFKTLEDFNNDNPYEVNVTKDIEIFKEDNRYWFYDTETKDLSDLTKYYKNLVKYNIHFFNDNGEISVSLNDIYNYTYSYIKIDMFYQPTYIVRNKYYSLYDYINKYNNYEYEFIGDTQLTIRKRNGEHEQEKTVDLIKLTPKYMYIDNDHFILNQNPAYYWINLDNNNIQTLPSYLNEIERYLYDAENVSEEDLIEMLDAYKEKCEHNNNDVTDYIDDSEEAGYHYNNYLSKDYTGYSGKYKLVIETDLPSSIKARMIMEVFDENNNRHIYKTDDIFELNGNENRAVLYIQLSNISNEISINSYIIPQLLEISNIEEQMKYDYEECGDDPLLVYVLNEEYYYGNNRSEFVYNLYNDFFDLKFNIYDTYEKNGTTHIQLLDSVYECNKNLKLNMYLNYDFYLMHDNQYWYGLYISKETCNRINKASDLIVPENNKKMTFVSKDNETTYMLKYQKSSKEYLINRFEFISSNGYNQFRDDDIVACYVHNNDRLPFNPYISSKWSISPMSLGMSVDSKFDSNAEMTILSIPKNDNKYQKGYYKATVKYSLDRDIQHQFKNTTTFKIS